ncbi:alpha/beta hydrolase [Thermoleophilum album]|uniref:alpha/beta hydrolase n=1 Tax=Thermoleophilum album TaxID=29539 RepID=UPI00237CD725|nr:alpha/beta hydrolase [Thermoleophilum album]WDT94064.1 alpha/beta hydrolase [Thermoleophilum album]
MPPADLQARLAKPLVRSLGRLPRPALAKLAGPPPAAAPDLEPEAQLLARFSERSPLPRIETLPVAAARSLFDAQVDSVTRREHLPVTTLEHTLPVGDVRLRARLYVPQQAPSTGPLLVYFHGGGFVLGSIATHDAPLRLLAHASGVRILSVDYRLAPEHRFPAAVEDAVAAFEHVAAEPQLFSTDPGSIAVGGDSAGGTLAAVVCQELRRRGGPLPCFQLLIYPATELFDQFPSRRAFARGFILTEEEMNWFADHYVPDRELRRDPRVSPLREPDLAGLPPAHVATAAADPLRDEGEEYARRLRAAGVPVSAYRHPHLHGFLNMTALPAARAGTIQIAGVLCHALSAVPREP